MENQQNKDTVNDSNNQVEQSGHSEESSPVPMRVSSLPPKDPRLTHRGLSFHQPYLDSRLAHMGLTFNQPYTEQAEEASTNVPPSSPAHMFNKALPRLPDPFLGEPALNSSVSGNDTPNFSRMSSSTKTIDPFFFSGTRAVLHSPYKLDEENEATTDGRMRPLFSKEALIGLDHHIHHLEIDLFCPHRLTSIHGYPTIFPKSDLSPLFRLRELRSLKLVGMQRSYQFNCIWDIVWMNPHLERLTLSMVEGPLLSRRAKRLGWRDIQGPYWKPRKLNEVVPKYRGDSADAGQLRSRYGVGEYLDVLAIAQAKVDTRAAFERDLGYDMPAKLQIKHLRLSGFVVDAFSINTCFDPNVLETLHFHSDCVDAGFAMNSKLGNVKLLIPASGRRFSIDS